jgi:hypothetical protein
MRRIMMMGQTSVTTSFTKEFDLDDRGEQLTW